MMAATSTLVLILGARPELVVDPSTIAGSLDGQPVRILADRRERRRLGLAPEPID
jgi:hypothetical protein